MLCENYKSCAAAGYTVLISWKKKDGKQNIYCEKNPFAESRIEFPLIRYEISPADLYSIFAELKNFYIEPVPVLHRAKDVICDETFKPANSHVSFIFDENSKKFVKLVDYFGEINRLKTRRNNQFESVWDLFGRVKDRVIYGLEGKQKITTADVYAEFTKFNPRFASEFNPAWMTAVIKYLRGFTKIENVLDMSAGRGARAIAAAATGCKYFGTDPNLDIDYETIINFYNVNGTVQYSAFEKASIKGPIRPYA
jgi:hypothetical protein